MIIDIHDVGHGACSVVTSSDGRQFMIDAGHRPEPLWAPSIHYAGKDMAMLLLQNLDSDHLSDMPYLLNHVRIGSLFSNPSVGHAALYAMKHKSGMNEALEKTYLLLRRYGPVFGTKAVFPDLSWWLYWNQYGVHFNEPNNLSVPIFVECNGFSILFGGDLEADGWKCLLRFASFRSRLARVNILVASHHGRDNGCCEEIFQFCRPDVVIVSDYELRHLSQQTTGWYAYRVKGIADNTRYWSAYAPAPMRKVLTTRNDGTLRICVEPSGQYTIYPERVNTAPSNFRNVGANGLLGDFAYAR